MSEARAFAADALVLLGLAGTSLSVLGALRLPDTFARIHASSQGVVLGVGLVLAATATVADPELASRAALVMLALLLTTPVSTHLLVRLAARRDLEPEPPDHPGGRGPSASTRKSRKSATRRGRKGAGG
jgi:multicomponent Na+:H+ antiporter subunit G